MNPFLDFEARRLFVSAALTTQVTRSLGGRIAANSGAEDLLNLARSLDAVRVERTHRLSFEPPYPGVTAGPQSVHGGLRLLLACHAFDRDGGTLGVVFTALIPGRTPQVSIAPSGTPIPEEWILPEETS